MSGTWRLRASTTMAGWLEIPELAAADREAWVAQRLAQLRGAWDAARWDAETEALVRLALTAAIDGRDPVDHLAFQVWTAQLPLAPVVVLRMADPAAMPDWSARGYRVLPYDAAVELGPGIECIARHELRSEAGETATLVHALYVFDVGEALVVAEVEPTPLQAFTLLAPGLAGLLGSLSVTRDDGVPIVARAPRSLSFAEDAAWLRAADEDDR